MSLRILLADDSMTAQNMGKKILTDGGYDVVTVSNGAAAIKKLAEFTPDMIIADVYMPGYNGLEICERVKKAAATAAVPVLLSVGKLEPFRPEEGVKVRADGIIIKPFEATDLLAVTAKLAERAGRRQAPAPAPEPEQEPAEAADVAAEDSASETQVVDAKGKSAEVPAFSIDEFGAQPAWEEHSAPVAAAFALDDHKPDYVREFGLDPHDAPTTTMKTVRDFAPPDSFVEQLPDFAASEPSLEPAADFAHATANLVINEVSLPEPVNVPGATEASTPADDFEAKLAAAMAEYEEPAVEHEPEVESHSEVMPEPTVAADAVSSAWVAQEEPLSESEMSLSLEDELRAFAAGAGAGAATLTPPSQVSPIAPSGPMGDTSFDDEVSALVEASKEQFFPASTMAEAVVSEAPNTVTDAVADESSFTERVNALLDHAGFAPAAEASFELAPTMVESAEVIAEPVNGVVPEEPVSTETVTRAVEEVSDAAPEIPELLTHDIASDWSPAQDVAASVAAETPSEILDETVPAEINATEDYLLSPHDFVSPEAPFAHAAVDEVATEQSVTTEPNEELTQRIEDAVAPQIAEQVAPEIAAQAEAAVERSKPSAPSLDEAAITDVVQRVMDRMRGDIISQIARELAAKLGK